MPSTTQQTSETTWSMGKAAKITGLSADTLRAWEKRYGAVRPARTEGGTRRYSSEDIIRLQLIRDASTKGHSLQELARLDNSALENLLRAPEPTGQFVLPAAGDPMEAMVADYLGMIERFSVQEAWRLLSRSAAVMDPRDFVHQVVMPLLNQVGDRWQSGHFLVVHEHIVSEQVRHLLQGISYFREVYAGAPVVLVATPEGQRHEFGAIVASFLASAHGHRTLYLGPSVPWSDLAVAARATKAHLLILSLIKTMVPDEIREAETRIAEISRTCPVWLGMPRGRNDIRVPRNCRIFGSFKDFDTDLASIR